MKTLLITITILISASLAGAEIQQRGADNGSVTIKNTPSPAPTAPAKKQRFSGTVEIYVTDWCGYCKQALSYMSSRGIPFVAYDIEDDSSAAQRHKELGGNGVPLIIIGANRMSGFSAKKLEYYLNNSR